MVKSHTREYKEMKKADSVAKSTKSKFHSLTWHPNSTNSSIQNIKNTGITAYTNSTW